MNTRVINERDYSRRSVVVVGGRLGFIHDRFLVHGPLARSNRLVVLA